VNGTSDRADTYRIDSDFTGTLQFDVTLGPETAPNSVVLVIRNAAGTELARQVVADPATTVSIDVPAGAAFVSVESLGGAASYRVSSHFDQADVAVSSVAPMSGPAGTLVTIH